MRSKNSICTLVVLLALSGCKPSAQPVATQPSTSAPSSSSTTTSQSLELPVEDVVFSRNLGRLWGNYDVLHEQYQLGTAYAKRPPQWWRELAEAQKFDSQATTFPLAFVGQWTSDRGVDRLIVLQMRLRFNGDGFLSAGPALWLAAYIFERTSSQKWSLVSSEENALNLNSMQNAHLLSGRWEERPKTISLQIEQRNAQRKMNQKKITGTITREGKIRFSPVSTY